VSYLGCCSGPRLEQVSHGDPEIFEVGFTLAEDLFLEKCSLSVSQILPQLTDSVLTVDILELLLSAKICPRIWVFWATSHMRVTVSRARERRQTDAAEV
jgi:hypothetical protein